MGRPVRDSCSPSSGLGPVSPDRPGRADRSASGRRALCCGSGGRASPVRECRTPRRRALGRPQRGRGGRDARSTMAGAAPHPHGAGRHRGAGARRYGRVGHGGPAGRRRQPAAGGRFGARHRAVGPHGCGGGARPGPLCRCDPPDAQPQARRALRGRRPPRLGRRTAAPHRLTGARGRLPQVSEAHRAWRKARLTTLDDALETRRRASPLWRAHDALWPRVPGSGPVGARTLLRALPAVGPRTRQPRAAWVGVAPRPGDRGTRRGRRTLWGGRAPGRTVWAMGPRVATRLHPQIKAFSQRLRTAGQSQQVALTACRRQLVTIRNALLQQRTSWQGQEVQT